MCLAIISFGNAASALGLLLLYLLEFTAGIILLTLGIHGTPDFGAPRCRRCRYDLRQLPFNTEEKTCPECGADLKKRQAVHFGESKRHLRRIIIGAIVLLSPIPTFLGVQYLNTRYLMNGSHPSIATPTASILAALPAHTDEPWYWQELERRATAGTFSVQEADAAMTILIAQVAKKRAANQFVTLNWQDGFIKAVAARHIVSPERFKELCIAFYGPSPFQLPNFIHRGEHVGLQIEYGKQPWSLPGAMVVWSIREQKLDGKPDNLIGSLRRGAMGPSQPDLLTGSRNDWAFWQLSLPPDLPAGTHEIEIVMDVGIVRDNAILIGMDGRPGPPEKWPAPLCTWQPDIKQKITLLEPGEKLRLAIPQITDPKFDPVTIGGLRLRRLTTRPSSSGVTLIPDWSNIDNLLVPICVRIQLHAGSWQADGGPFIRASGFQGGSSAFNVSSLPHDLQKVDVTLTPDAGISPTPNLSPQFSAKITSIWGKPIEFKDVPLDRHDLE